MTSLISIVPCPSWLGPDITVQTEIPDGADYLTRENLTKKHIDAAFTASAEVTANVRNIERRMAIHRQKCSKIETGAVEEVAA